MKYLNNEKYTFFNKNERNKFIKDNVLFDLNDDSILKIEDGNYEIIFNKIIKA